MSLCLHLQAWSHLQVFERTKDPSQLLVGRSIMTLLEAYSRNSLELLKFSAVLAYLSASYIGSAATALTRFVVYDFAVKDDDDQKEGQGESNEGEHRGVG